VGSGKIMYDNDADDDDDGDDEDDDDDDGNEDEDDDDNVADDDERFQLRSVYFQLVQFSFLHPEEISRIVRISIDINLLSDDFPFKPKRHLKEPRGLIN
jgi:ABC-type Zn2+ transport system substrate-binding protein/surface adhesin